MPIQGIIIRYRDEEEKKLLEWFNRVIAPSVDSLNDQRIRIAGVIGLPQKRTLPGPAESVRELYTRFTNFFSRLCNFCRRT